MIGRGSSAGNGPVTSTVTKPLASGGSSKPVIIGAVIVAIAAAWFLFIVMIGQLGGSEQTSSSGTGPPPGADTAERSGSDGGQSADQEGSGDPASTDDSSSTDSGSQPDYDSASDSSGTDSSGTDTGSDYSSTYSSGTENVSYDDGSAEQETMEPYASPPSGSEDGSEDEDSTQLNPEQQTRARTAAEQYISAAYGYTGTSHDDYMAGIGRTASEEILSSPGGERLEDYSNAAPECGMASTATLDEFEIVETAPEGIAATAYFTVTDGQDAHTFKQDQILKATDEGGYQMLGVSVEELTSDTQPMETCPGNIPGEPNPRSSADGAATQGAGPDQLAAELAPDQAAAAEEAVRAHYEAIGAGEFERAYSYFGPSYKGIVPARLWVQSHVDERIESSSIDSLEVGRNSGGAAQANVTVSFTDAAGQHTFEIVWTLLEDGGSYKLDTQSYGRIVQSTATGEEQ